MKSFKKPLTLALFLVKEISDNRIVAVRDDYIIIELTAIRDGRYKMKVSLLKLFTNWDNVYTEIEFNSREEVLEYINDPKREYIVDACKELTRLILDWDLVLNGRKKYVNINKLIRFANKTCRDSKIKWKSK